MRRFDYAAPTTIEEACQLLSSNQSARPLAGGTDLLIQMKERGRPVPLLVSLRWVKELSNLETNGQLELGSMVTCGEVDVLRVVAAHDCGRIINPMLVDSQVIGAVTQGIGFALTEERVVDARSGVVLNANLEEYKVPTVADVPEIVHARVGRPDPEANPTGAKGIGEPPLVPTAPAIANAVFDAVGVRIRHAPLSRDKLLAALADRAAERTDGRARGRAARGGRA